MRNIHIWVPDELVDEIAAEAELGGKSFGGYLIGLHRRNVASRLPKGAKIVPATVEDSPTQFFNPMPKLKKLK